jgi:hypothetical protein
MLFQKQLNAMKNKGRFFSICVCVALFFITTVTSFGQGQDKSVIFRGKVVAARTSDFLPSAYVFNQRSGRGTLTDDLGNFKLMVYPNDSIVFTYVGYKRKYYIIPSHVDQVHAAYIHISEESQMLSEVKVYPYNTEDAFKKAFLEMKLDDEAGRRALEKNLDQSKLNVLALKAGLSGAGNFRNFSDQMTYGMANRGFVNSPMMALTNPFAWANFIQSIKRGDLKKTDYKKAYEDAPTEGISRQRLLREMTTGGN